MQLEETLTLRVWAEGAGPTLVYLPGLHGDWTMIGSLRNAVCPPLRFVEMTYPRTLSWSLEEYAAAIEEELRRRRIESSWLLAESFGSQIAWPLATRNRFRVQGIILAGGFARHPLKWGVRIAEAAVETFSARTLAPFFWCYAQYARWRYRHAPEVLKDLSEFLSRRTDADRLAAGHRLRLIAQNNPCDAVQRLDIPVYALVGVLDPIVPWLPVRRWFSRNCGAFRESRVIWSADHAVLATAPQKSAKWILTWMKAA